MKFPEFEGRRRKKKVKKRVPARAERTERAEEAAEPEAPSDDASIDTPPVPPQPKTPTGFVLAFDEGDGAAKEPAPPKRKVAKKKRRLKKKKKKTTVATQREPKRRLFDKRDAFAPRLSDVPVDEPAALAEPVPDAEPPVDREASPQPTKRPKRTGKAERRRAREKRRLEPDRPPPQRPERTKTRWRIGDVVDGYRLTELIPSRPGRRTFRAVGVDRERPALVETWPARAGEAAPSEKLTDFEAAGVMRVFALGEAAGRRYAIVERADGESLARTLAWARQEGEPAAFGRGVDGVNRAAALVECTARCLAPLHEAGAHHGHLGPRELWLDAVGAPLVLGVGVEPARYRSPRADEFAYVAPEQWDAAGRQDQGRAIGPPADVFALAVILFESLTLQTPFAGPTERTYVDNVRHGEIRDAAAMNPAVTTPLIAVLERALERDPAHRYADAAAFAEALAIATGGEPPRAARGRRLRALRRWMRRHHRLALAAAVMVFASTMTVAYAVLGMTANLRDAGRAESSARADERRVTALNHLRFRDDVHRLEREAERLWLSRPEWEAAMEAWLIRADRISEMRDAIDDARQRAAAMAKAWSPRERTWAETQFTALAADLDRLTTLRTDVAERLAAGRADHEASVTQQGPTWQRCLRAIAINPRYAESSFGTEPGLVPLGPDPDSGLHEFAHVSSGDLPRRDPATGRIDPRPRDAIVLVLIPATEIPQNDGPPRYVAPFFIAKYEVTAAQLARLAGEGRSASELPATNRGWAWTRDVLARVGLTLPTEVQWEIAATGDLLDPREGEQAGGGVRPIGRGVPNGYGLYDTGGNVAEWCLDAFAPLDFPPRPGDGLRIADDRAPHVVKGAHHLGGGSAADANPVSHRRASATPSRLIGVRPARWSSGRPRVKRADR